MRSIWKILSWSLRLCGYLFASIGAGLAFAGIAMLHLADTTWSTALLTSPTRFGLHRWYHALRWRFVRLLSRIRRDALH
ncbi:MAG TPA: hypothetical protein VNR11_20010 [Xanthobacteraceae bacterium]|nr:hypothetical protein [Xanthobacteraceae bacterium]